jgi:hypothetical protein
MRAARIDAQIRDMSPDDEMYAAKVIVLGEYINHHVEEEHERCSRKRRRQRNSTCRQWENAWPPARARSCRSMGMEDDEGEGKPIRRPARRSNGASARPARA